MSRNRHPLQQTKGITLHQHAIGEGTAIALVRIDADILMRRRVPRLAGMRLCRLFGHCAPLNTGRESRSTATAQTRGGDNVYDGIAAHSKRVLQAG